MKPDEARYRTFIARAGVNVTEDHGARIAKLENNDHALRIRDLEAKLNAMVLFNQSTVVQQPLAAVSMHPSPPRRRWYYRFIFWRQP